MDQTSRAVVLCVLLAGCLAGYEAAVPETESENRHSTTLCSNCPKTTTTRRTTTHSTQPTTPPTTAHTNHTTAPLTTTHTNHTTAPLTTTHTNHTTAPQTTTHTNHTTAPLTTTHTNHTTAPLTTTHTNHTTAPLTTTHTNHTTAPLTTTHTNHTTAHMNQTTAPPTTAHSNHTTAPPTTTHANHTMAPPTAAHSNQTTAHTNHTTASPHPTEHGNHTVAPHTTAHSNHTEPFTTQHPTVGPTPSEYFVNGTSGVCLRIQATFVLAMNITKPYNYTIPPPPTTQASGNCTEDTAQLRLKFPSGALSLTFMKDKKENMFYFGNTSLVIRTPEGQSVMSASGNAMRTPLGRSFTCKEVVVSFLFADLEFLDLKVQAFELEGGNFGREVNCKDSRSKTVPIVVGIVLLVLIVVVVIAYLIGRKKRPSGYERL